MWQSFQHCDDDKKTLPKSAIEIVLFYVLQSRKLFGMRCTQQGSYPVFRKVLAEIAIFDNFQVIFLKSFSDAKLPKKGGFFSSKIERHKFCDALCQKMGTVLQTYFSNKIATSLES